MAATYDNPTGANQGQKATNSTPRISSDPHPEVTMLSKPTQGVRSKTTVLQQLLRSTRHQQNHTNRVNEEQQTITVPHRPLKEVISTNQHHPPYHSMTDQGPKILTTPEQQCEEHTDDGKKKEEVKETGETSKGIDEPNSSLSATERSARYAQGHGNRQAFVLIWDNKSWDQNPLQHPPPHTIKRKIPKDGFTYPDLRTLTAGLKRKPNTGQPELPKLWPPPPVKDCLVHSPEQPPLYIGTPMGQPREQPTTPPIKTKRSKLKNLIDPGRNCDHPNAQKPKSSIVHQPNIVLLIWALTHPRLMKDEALGPIPPVPQETALRWNSSDVRVVGGKQDPLDRGYQCPMNWKGAYYPNRECVIQLERVLHEDQTIGHPKRAQMFILKHARMSAHKLRKMVDERLRQISVISQRRLTWEHMQHSTLVMIYVQSALTNFQVLTQLLDPAVRAFTVSLPTDQTVDPEYSNTTSSSIDYSRVLMHARVVVRTILKDLRLYVVNYQHTPSPLTTKYLTENILREYNYLYEFHALYSPTTLPPYPLKC